MASTLITIKNRALSSGREQNNCGIVSFIRRNRSKKDENTRQVEEPGLENFVRSKDWIRLDHPSPPKAIYLLIFSAEQHVFIHALCLNGSFNLPVFSGWR